MSTTNQEMFCTACYNYFEMPLLRSFNGIVKCKCPGCDHLHQRRVSNGRIIEEGRYDHGEAVEEIIVPKSALYKESKVAALRKKFDQRDGVLLTDADQQRNAYMADLWVERFGPNADPYGD